jgi:predicted metalloprotease with PDZ domain
MSMSEVTVPTYRVRVLPARHELEVELMVPAALARSPLRLQVATWVPGAYAFMKYGRDLFELKATDLRSGEPLPCTRDGWQGFRVEPKSGGVRVAYKIYGYDPAWGELVGLVDHAHAVLLGTRYLHLPGYDGPCRVTYELPEGWRLHHPAGARALDERLFEYPSYATLLDTPVVAGEFTALKRVVHGTTFHFVFLDQAVGFASEVERFLDAQVRIAEECHALFGSFPFDHYTYVFSFNPSAHWGLEHASSTMIGLGPNAFVDPNEWSAAMRVSAHELFHAWNVCRLKPAPLARLDHAGGNFTEGLWVAEGFTRYYEFVLCARAGVLTAEQVLSNVVNYYRHLEAMPAYARVSAADSSLATFLNHNKYPGSINNTIDYYDKGMLIAFDMDALLRTSSPGGTLDHEVRAFYEAYVGQPEGFTTRHALGFFGPRAPGMESLLRREVEGPAGLSTLDQLQKLGFEVKEEAVRYLGVVLKENAGPAVVNVLDTSRAGQSGLAPEDELLKVNGFPFNLKAFKWLIAREPRLSLEVRRGHRYLTFELPTAERRQVSALSWRGTEAQAALLREWLKRPDFQPVNGQAIPLGSFENFHGIQTVL